MTREQTKAFLEASIPVSGEFFSKHFAEMRPILQAYAEGKQIQIFDTNWIEQDFFEFNDSPENYRIKPNLPETIKVTLYSQEYEIDVQKAIDLGVLKV